MSATHPPITTKSRRALGAALGLALVVAAAPFLNSASAAQPTVDATAAAETDAVTGANATAKDSAIWVHPTDRMQSLILAANDTRLEVYNLAGDKTIQGGVPAPAASNPPDAVVTGVDVRPAVTLGTTLIGDVATVVGKSLVRFYLIDPLTGKLSNTTIDAAGVKAETFTTENHSMVCMYQSPVSNKTYAFVLANNGEMGQLELMPSADKIDISMVRGGKTADLTWDAIPTVDHEAGGCVVDDDTKTLYVTDKTGGVFKFGAEPTDAKTGTLVDDIANGHLLAKIQGLEIVETAPGQGYLIAASFNDAPTTDPAQFTVYDRATGAFVRTFKVLDGAADMCQQTTSIAAAAGNLGAGFTNGMFVCNDKKNRPADNGNNTDPNNYKMVSLDLIVDMAPPTTTTTTLPVVTTPTTPPIGVPGTSNNNNRSGYWMVGNDGKVYAFGEAKTFGDATLPAGAQAVDLEPTPSGNGYWILDDLGHVFAKGDAKTIGDVSQSLLVKAETITSLSSTKSGNGYWVFTSAGRAIPFGDAVTHGDMSQTKLNGPVLDSITTPSGNGYYMVGSDGGIFSFGDAKFYGSMGDKKLNAPVQSLVPDSDGVGYWLVASDGGIFAFDAPFRGSMGDRKLNKPVTGMVRYGTGYLMVGEDGGIFSFSDKPFAGSLGAAPPAKPITSVAVLDVPKTQ